VCEFCSPTSAAVAGEPDELSPFLV
jgi:hypothetical protein